MLVLGLIEALEDSIMTFAMIWLGGILLCAAPYLWACALCLVSRDRSTATEQAGPSPRREC